MSKSSRFCAMTSLACRYGCFVLLLLWPGRGLAQRVSVDPPLVGRPADFSNVIGSRYRIRATATPAEVEVEKPITLRVAITGEGPPYGEPKRETLSIFPKTWDKDFYVEEIREEHQVNRAEKSWTFVYRLKPKHTKIDAITGIKLVYWNPEAPLKKQFPTEPADSIPITVHPAAKIIDTPIPDLVFAPESVYQTVALDASRTSAATPLLFSALAVVVFLMAVPLTCVIAAIIWKQCFPNEWKRLRRQRSKAADLALTQLRTEEGPVWQIVHQYLQQRFDLSQAEPTPAEVEIALLRRGFARELCGQCRTLLQTCDALRYGALPNKDGTSLASSASGLIAALEADPAAVGSHKWRVTSDKKFLPLVTRHLSLPIAMLFAVTFLSAATAQDNDALAAEAEHAFRQGVEHRTQLLQARQHWSQATDLYLRLYQQGVRSPALFLNLGNAATLADRWPVALWSYQSGLKLDPNDTLLRAHRDFVRAKVMLPPSAKGRPESEFWPAWLYRPSIDWLTAIAAFAYVLCCITATLALLLRRPRFFLWSVAALFAAAVAGFGLWYEIEQAEVDRQTPLVVLHENTPFYRGNGKNYPQHVELPMLPRGMEARQLHRRGGWLQIRLSSGEVGWVPLSEVLVVEA